MSENEKVWVEVIAHPERWADDWEPVEGSWLDDFFRERDISPREVRYVVSVASSETSCVFVMQDGKTHVPPTDLEDVIICLRNVHHAPFVQVDVDFNYEWAKDASFEDFCGALRLALKRVEDKLKRLGVSEADARRLRDTLECVLEKPAELIFWGWD